jgi:DUF1365 family protein
VKSALYEGMITHRRHATEATTNVAHDFRYSTLAPLLFLDELDALAAMHSRWSVTRPNAAWFRRRDYLGDAAVPLDTAVRDEVAAQTARRPTGDIAMLGHVRLWGWLFNPLCVYYYFDESGQRVDQILLEVRSTPWHERHLFVLDGASTHHRFAKAMHVSPFLGVDHESVLTWSAPGEHLSLYLGNRRREERIFDASLSLTRREITPASMGAHVGRRPFQTLGVSAGIYRQALSLWRKKAPCHSHPRRLEMKAAAAKASRG